MKAKYYDASSKIIEATATVLVGFVFEYEAGLFHCEHPNMGEVRDLVARYDALVEDSFSEIPDMQEWLLDVAIALPDLWD